MATKTDMVNLALLKLQGVTSGATQIIESAIAAAVFADPSTASGTNKDDIRLFCTLYPFALKQAINDIRPKFARSFADLGNEIEATIDNSNLLERGDWSYMFELPTDYLGLLRQTSETDLLVRVGCEIITRHSWAHVVEGDDGQAYYCSTAHTSVDDSNDGQPTDDDGNGNWTLFNADGDYGATWEESKIYYADRDSHLFVTNEYSNSDGDSAYIEYLAYAQAGVSDDPNLYSDHFIQAFTTLLAAQAAPYSTENNRRLALLEEYHKLVMPDAMAIQARPDYYKKKTSWLDARTA